ncbi:MAG: hypothetical protein ACWGMZ_10340, partial [Thermoguttaceae bacterium]
MPTSETRAVSENATAVKANGSVLPSDLKRLLERSFRFQLAFFDGSTGAVLQESPDVPTSDRTLLSEMCRLVAQRGRPEFIEEEDPFITLALPFCDVKGNSVVAVGTFLTRHIQNGESLVQQAKALGINPQEAAKLAAEHNPWTPESLLAFCELIFDYVESRRQIKALQEETS